MKIGNRKIEFAARRAPSTFNFLPRCAVYASPISGWNKWAFELAWLVWGIGFMAKRIRR